MKHLSWVRAMALSAVSLFFVFSSQAFESPAVADAQTILGNLAQGQNYSVEADVRSDGLLHIFIVNSNYGQFQINGDTLMRQRIQELRAMSALEKMSQSDVFTKSFGKAAAAPLLFGVALVTKPGDTIARSVSGVANMFDAAGAAMQNQSSNRDTAAGSLLGVDAARRQIAVELGVDPYTDFSPLNQKLQEIASAAAMGGLTVRAALAVIPGGVGTVVSGTSSVSSVKDSLRDKTSSQILQDVRLNLKRARVQNDAITRLIQNRNYTPADLLLMSRALVKLNAGKTTLFIQRAAEAKSRDVAVFQRRRAELLAGRTSSVTEFVSIGGFPLNRTNAGGIIAVFPLDEVSWTPTNARVFSAVTDQLRGMGLNSAPTLVTPGGVTSEAQNSIKKLGWKIFRLN